MKREPVCFSISSHFPFGSSQFLSFNSFASQKSPEDHFLGIWLFEGKLRFGKALVGTWRNHSSTGVSEAKGIFSLAKKV